LGVLATLMHEIQAGVLHTEQFTLGVDFRNSVVKKKKKKKKISMDVKHTSD
jgi:hypothetical protein